MSHFQLVQSGSWMDQPNAVLGNVPMPLCGRSLFSLEPGAVSYCGFVVYPIVSMYLPFMAYVYAFFSFVAVVSESKMVEFN